MKEKLCVVPTDGRIAELGGIIGPVSRPTKISYSAIVSMLNRGVPVYEVNPKNVNERVRLNFRNVNSVNFFPKVKKSQPTTVNPYKLPEGRRNTVVEHTGEAAEVAKEKAAKKEAKSVNIEVVKKSDF